MACWRSGLTHQPFTLAFRGSNPLHVRNWRTTFCCTSFFIGIRTGRWRWASSEDEVIFPGVIYLSSVQLLREYAEKSCNRMIFQAQRLTIIYLLKISSLHSTCLKDITFLSRKERSESPTCQELTDNFFVVRQFFIVAKREFFYYWRIKNSLGK